MNNPYRERNKWNNNGTVPFVPLGARRRKMEQWNYPLSLGRGVPFVPFHSGAIDSVFFD